MTEKSCTHYVIVVHGIGEQRRNETLLPVVEQFAWARRPEKLEDKPRKTLTLARLSARYAGRSWVEFGGIPQATPQLSTPWTPQDPLSDGGDIRFVEIHWADIMREQYPEVGEPVARWSSRLIDRLELCLDSAWIVDIVKRLRSGAVWLERLIKFRFNPVATKVFHDFLGDVQLYGEYPETRGKAVRHFHEVLTKLHAEHTQAHPNTTPAYTILAHSLGTVLSLDALLYAFANDESRNATAPSEDPRVVWLAGYQASKKAVGVAWREHVRSFVTLGSPIGKFLTLWAENYEHLKCQDWMDVPADHCKIQHFNYFDEQDPVGGELAVAYRRRAVAAVFDPVEDEVSNRYPWPGFAHVDYWKDRDLFRRLVHLTIDQTPPSEAHEVPWFLKVAYAKTMLVSYALVPTVTWFFGTLIAAVMLPDQILSKWSILLVIWALVAMQFTYLNIYWRQSVAQARLLAGGEGTAEHVAANEEWANARKRWGTFVRWLIRGAPLVWGYWLLALTTPSVPIPELLRISNEDKLAALALAWLVSIWILLVYGHVRNGWVTRGQTRGVFRVAMEAAWSRRPEQNVESREA